MVYMPTGERPGHIVEKYPSKPWNGRRFNMLGQLIASGIVVGDLHLMALGMTVKYQFDHRGELLPRGVFHGGCVGTADAVQTGLADGFLHQSFALVMMYAIGSLIERGLLRPLQNAPHISLTMMTVALSYLLKGLSRFFYGREVIPLPPILAGDPFEFFDIVLAP